MKFFPYLSLIFALFCVVSACSTTPGDPNSMICKELKSQMILNGATVNVQRSEIQRAESQLQQRDYHAIGCDEIHRR